MEKKKTGCFDMAGTTIDEDNLVYKTVQKAINEYGYNVSLEEVLQYGSRKRKKATGDKRCTGKIAQENRIQKNAGRNYIYIFPKALEQAYDEVQVKTRKRGT